MSTEGEFELWLRSSEKTFTENLQFALKAWQSAEFTLSSKYELVLTWLAEQGDTLTVQWPVTELGELLKLRAQPGLVSQQIKSNFVEMLLTLAERLRNDNACDNATRALTDLLWQLNDFELLQDLYRSNYALHARVYASILEHYEWYLRHCPTLSLAQESEFFSCLMGALKESAKRSGDSKLFEESYSAAVVQPLAQVLLVLRTHSLCFFDELLELEHTLTESFSEKELLERALQLPLHVRLLVLECSIVNRRGVDKYIKLLLQRVFIDMLTAERDQNPALALTVAAYTLETLRKHAVTLTFEAVKNRSALAYLGELLVPYVQKFKDTHLREVLMLLGAALRLNPLILEQHVFHVTTWMIVSQKCDGTVEQALFEEYLVLLLDMFRRLSRTDKLVGNLLKALREWFQQYQLPAGLEKGKRKSSACAETTAEITPPKKQKLADGTAAQDSDKLYLDVLFSNFYKSTSNAASAVSASSSSFGFPLLQCLWPSATVGVAFAKLITGLVSKPSLVVWKTLLYSMKELLAELNDQEEISGNALVRLDLHAALLCQYFAGSKLADQFEKFMVDISDQCRLTAEVLSTFGRFLLARDHQPRTLNAFLECSFHAISFQLLLAYYRPDGVAPSGTEPDTTVAQLSAFLTKQEWTVVQERALNSGKSSCKLLMNRLLLQRVESRMLLLSPSTNDSTEEAVINKFSFENVFDEPVCSGREHLAQLLKRTPYSAWLMAHLHREDKLLIAAQVLTTADLIDTLGDDTEAVEFAALAIFELLATAIASCKKSLLAALHCDFEALRLGQTNDTIAADKQIKQLVAAINTRSDNYTLKKLPREEIESALSILARLPLGWLPRKKKTLFFALQITLYSDLRAGGADDLAAIAFETLKDLMHFGLSVPIFKYFSTTSILRLLPAGDCWPLYEAIFDGIRHEEKGTEAFLTELTEILRSAQEDDAFNDDHRRLTLIAVEALGSVTGPAAKRMRKYLKSILAVYAAHVHAHFTQASTAAGDKEFVEKTLAGFAPYASAELTQTADSADQVAPVDENFRRVCKIYIGYSMDHRNPHAIRLMQVALNHRQQLHLDQDEIELVLSGYWQQLNADIRTQQQSDRQLESKTIGSVLEMLISYKTNEDFLLTLKDIGRDMTEKDFAQVLRLLSLMAKCPFGAVKGAIFNEQYKQITSEIALCLTKDDRQQFINTEHVLSVLDAHRSFAENRGLPLTLDTLDTMITFALNINIKKFVLNDSNTRIFHELHLALSELAMSLIKQRHLLLMDRVPHFIHIFKDLLQSIVWYKSDRQKDSALPTSEVDDLAILAQKMEALMHIIATHSVGVKRVAPFALTFAINLVVANKRSTTLYPKIKTHIDNICYDLIGICDHRVGNFILRSSNEAARNVYELLVKNHKKYHKFKGKV